MRSLLLATALVATPVSAATDQFDLVCRGQQKLSANGRPTPKETRYRIDLARKSWCTDQCKEVRPIQDVSQGQIVIEAHERTNSEDFTVRHTIDRTTGAWTNFYSSAGVRTRMMFSPGAWWETNGNCEAAEFSGFPAPRF